MPPFSLALCPDVLNQIRTLFLYSIPPEGGVNVNIASSTVDVLNERTSLLNALAALLIDPELTVKWLLQVVPLFGVEYGFSIFIGLQIPDWDSVYPKCVGSNCLPS